jgi:hypothetical protein
MLPLMGSRSPEANFNKQVLPDPEGPNILVNLPLFIVKFKLSHMLFCIDEYEKHMFLKIKSFFNDSIIY